MLKKNVFGKYEVAVYGGKRKTGLNPVEYAQRLERHGAGEIMLTSIDRDGTWSGYDIDLVRHVSDAVNIPVIASGGAGQIDDIGTVVKQGHASAAALGSMAVFQAKGLGVLIKFPKPDDISKVLL
jgi:cyclase